MNITFLIGNGFDIGMGMRSAFRDFFPIYQVKSIDKVSRIRRLSQEIGADYETWADFESALGKYTLNFTPETKQDFIDQLKDFEKDFIDYLKGQKEMLSFDTFKSISDMMVDALIGYYNNGNLAYESKLAISRIYSQHAAENHVYNFVNFNYTDVLEQCLATIPQQIVCKRKYNGVERIDKLGRTVHIHGTCDFQPIIGVNDISQIANQELAKDSRFTSFIVKPSLNQLMRLGNDGATQTLINQSAIICIYGMSLGSTDRNGGVIYCHGFILTENDSWLFLIMTNNIPLQINLIG